MYKLYTENMPYPDLSITLVKSVKSLRCTWVVAATLIALPEYYQNRFRLSWLNITQKGILKKGRFPESLFLSLPPRRSPESRRKVNGSCGVGLVSLAAVFWMSRNAPPPSPPPTKKIGEALRDIQKTAVRETRVGWGHREIV